MQCRQLTYKQKVFSVVDAYIMLLLLMVHSFFFFLLNFPTEIWAHFFSFETSTIDLKLSTACRIVYIHVPAFFWKIWPIVNKLEPFEI